MSSTPPQIKERVQLGLLKDSGRSIKLAKKEIPPDIQALLKQVADHFDKEDQAVRERQIRTWRKLKLYWNNFTNIWYNEVAHDWRIFEPTTEADSYEDQAYYDRPVNVFRAYLESIIAALSVTVPAVTCYPDDATNPLDLQTAKAGDKIAEVVYRHNDVTLLWLHALYIYCTEGMVACYSYPKADEAYGTYEERVEKDQTSMEYLCPHCQAKVSETVMQFQQAQQMQEIQDQEQAATLEQMLQQSIEEIINESEAVTATEEDEYMPDDDDVAIQNEIMNEDALICPECLQELDPAMEKSPLIVTRLVGVTKQPKTRICLEAYGGLYVKVPNYAMKQSDMPYLRFSYETHYSNVIERYPHLADKAKSGSQGLTGLYDPYESWGRLSPQYNGEYPINNSTVNNYWFRPSAFNVVDEEGAKKLKELFPNGCKYVKINECFAEAENEALDDCWTLTYNPLSDYIQHDPLGLLLTSIQDITNELVSLILQTVEHGIPQGFADPGVLNFEQYRQQEVAPGMVFPAKSKSGQPLSNAFHEIKTATLSPEVMPLGEMIQQFGQLVVGAQPSIFGGQLEGSKTASEYSMSRAQALQRLQTPWKMLVVFWKTIFGKVIPMYIKEVIDDERTVEKDNQGNFINIFIRKAELAGKLGRIELEGTENLPMTWLQQKDALMQIMQAGNPALMEALMSPENLPLLKKAVGIPEFTVPGEEEREAEFEEIQQLINSEPLVMPGTLDEEEMVALEEAGQPSQQQEEFPSVEPDPDIDNHALRAEIDRTWLISSAGRLAKLENPAGYRNVLLHFKMHKMFEQQQMLQEALMAGAAGGEEQEEGKPQNSALSEQKENEDTDGQRATVN